MQVHRKRIAADSESFPPLTKAQKKLIERRLAEHERDPSSAIPWEVVRARLWARRFNNNSGSIAPHPPAKRRAK